MYHNFSFDTLFTETGENLSSSSHNNHENWSDVQIITYRHPNPLFSVCIISPNAERKIMQTKCVRKTGAVFFVAGKLSGVILHVLNRHAALLKHGGSIIKTKTSCIIKNNAACFSFNNAACFTCIYPLVKHFPRVSPIFFTD